jgi:glycosyltransferase involved in cell wall biosynthesis
MAGILILTAKVAFTRGGQEVLVSNLLRELRARGHDVDTVEVPLRIVEPIDFLKQALIWKTLNLEYFSGKKVDLVIATKFPTYCTSHPCKSLWLVHQERSAYELLAGRFSDFSDDPRESLIREELLEIDSSAIAKCKFIGSISHNVSERLKLFNGLNSEVLYPPLPLGNRYRSESPSAETYILSVGRICTIKRVDLIIQAMSSVNSRVQLKIVGSPDEPGIMEYLQSLITLNDLQERVTFLGRVSDDELISLYAEAWLVFYAPFDEDYGYVTLEALASGKPVLTGVDSGGTLEFIKHHETGLVVEPDPRSMSDAINQLYLDIDLRDKIVKGAKKFIEERSSLFAGWDNIIDRLLSPISSVRSSERMNE